MQGPTMLAVQTPAPGVRVVRLGGVLDAAMGARLAALAQVQMSRAADEEPDGPAHLLLDLAGVRSVGPGGVEALIGVRDAARPQGVHVHVTGLSWRQLPDLRHRLSCYPTLECALHDLAVRPGAPPSGVPLVG
jgi:hypothetical protein